MIKYRLTNARKNQNILVGDGISDIFRMRSPYVKNIDPEILTTLG